jgi:hypothetical protein
MRALQVHGAHDEVQAAAIQVRKHAGVQGETESDKLQQVQAQLVECRARHSVAEAELKTRTSVIDEAWVL